MKNTIFLLLCIPFVGIAQPVLKVREVKSGLTQVVDIASNQTDDRIFVAENAGLIKIIKETPSDVTTYALPFLDLRANIGTTYSGIQGIAFHPNYAQNGLFFVKYYRSSDKAIVISQYKVSTNPNIIDATSEQVLFQFPNYSGGHLGGNLAFGKDGFLYTTFGDGDSGGRGDKGDRYAYAQNSAYIYGKLMKLDVNTAKYEIVASGLRNAWRISFDRQTGDLWIGDVGQDRYEEINYVPTGQLTGKNFGWGCYEGKPKHIEANCLPNTIYQEPLIEYAGFDLNGGKAVSVTGGFAFRNSTYPELSGYYVYADYVTGEFWLARQSNGSLTLNKSQGILIKNPVTFGETQNGRVLVASYSEGKIYELVPEIPIIEYGAYLQQASPSSITVCWKTDIASDSRVSFGIENYNNIVEDTTKTRYHAVKLTGLKPNTKYTYAIGTTDRVLQHNPENYFVTPSNDANAPLRIWAIGDFGDVGKYKINQEAVRDAYYEWHKKRQTDVWLWLGDNAYCCGTENEYKNLVFDVYQQKFSSNTPFYAVAGNHEYYADASMQRSRKIPFLNIVNNPTKGELGGVPSGDELYYAFDYGEVHFVALDSYGLEQGIHRLWDKDSPQQKWLIQDLTANKKKWTILFLHHPPYTKRSHDSDFENELTQIRQNLVPIFDQFKVDLVLSGHSHIYERSYLIKGHTGFSTDFVYNQHVVQKTNLRYDGNTDSCPAINKQDGTVYAVVGSSGRLDVHPTGVQFGQHPSSAYSNIDIGGGLVIDVEQNRLDAKWLTSKGEVLDQFTVLKEVNKNTKLNVEYGQKVTLTASWKGTQRWSNGTKNKQNIEIQPLSSTIVTVSDSLNCLQDKFEITVSPQPELHLIPVSGTICNGSNLNVDFSVKNTDLNNYTYMLELSDANGSFTKPIKLAEGKVSPIKTTIPDSVSGNYKIRVMANSDFFAYGSPMALNINKKATATISGSQTIEFGKTATIQVNASGTPPLTVRLSDGQEMNTEKNTVTFSVIPKGNTTYTVDVSNVCGLGKTTGEAIITVPLANELNQSDWKTMPNPFKEELNIETPQELIGASFFVLDISGAVVYQGIINNIKTNINTNTWSSGLYLVQIRKGNWQSAKKVVK